MGSSKMSYGVMGTCAAMLAMMMIMAGGASGQAPAAAPSVDCDAVVLQLVDCLPFVTGSASTPPATCCTNLSAIIENTPQCLCQLYNTTFTAPLGVNVTRALQLPPACKLTTPPTSLCSLVGVPVPGPASAPVPAAAPAPTAPSSVPTPAGVPAPLSTAAPGSPPTSTPPATGVPPPTAPSAEMTPPTTASPPPSPNNSASSLAARSFAAVASLLAAFALLLH